MHRYDNYGVLRCSLLRVPFREEALIPYAAISYTWNEAEKLWYGDYDTSQKPVRINGVAVLVRDKVANIICLAEQVLSYICLSNGQEFNFLKHSKKLLWIDAICINQEDDKGEKSHQVARMGAIYGCASEVLSFLGSPGHETDELIDQINSISNSENSNHKLAPKFLMSFMNFLANDYWRRA